MLKTKRKRAVVLALIAFFCTAATTYVAVDWKRFGGGFLAYFRGNGDATVASKPGSGVGGSGGVRVASADDTHDGGASLPRLSGSNGRKHTAEASHGAGPMTATFGASVAFAASHAAIISGPIPAGSPQVKASLAEAE